MPIEKYTDHSEDLTTLTVTGDVTLPEILDVLAAFQDDPPANNILWDFSQSGVGDAFSSDDFQKTASLAKSKLGLRPGSKTAFVATSDVIFGLIRMYTTYLEFQEIAHEVKVFRVLDKAREWLKEGT